MKKSGLADSPLFAVPVRSIANPLTPAPRATKARIPDHKTKVKQSGNHDTTAPRHQDTVIPPYHDTILPVVRKALKEFGKEAATHRFTLSEKRSIADIIYTYKNQGIKTSENEIARIAVNFIIEDIKLHGKKSILDTIIKALRE